MSELNAASEEADVIRYDRLQSGPYYADFRRDRRLSPEVYHCVIQREGSTEILRWSQHHTLDAAIVEARDELSRLSEEHAQLPGVPVQRT